MIWGGGDGGLEVLGSLISVPEGEVGLAEVVLYRAVAGVALRGGFQHGNGRDLQAAGVEDGTGIVENVGVTRIPFDGFECEQYGLVEHAHFGGDSRSVAEHGR